MVHLVAVASAYHADGRQFDLGWVCANVWAHAGEDCIACPHIVAQRGSEWVPLLGTPEAQAAGLRLAIGFCMPTSWVLGLPARSSNQCLRTLAVRRKSNMAPTV